MTLLVRFVAEPGMSRAAIEALVDEGDIWKAGADWVVARLETDLAGLPVTDGVRAEILCDHVDDFIPAASVCAPGAYHSCAMLEEDMRALAESAPDICSFETIGRSFEGRAIPALRLGRQMPGANAALVVGCHLAREWISVEVPFHLARMMVERRADPLVASLLENGHTWIVPMLNPDGHEFTRTQDRLWRKNRRVNSDGSIGVDLSRNYAVGWDASLASTLPTSSRFRGTAPFSEPESLAIAALFARQIEETGRPFTGMLSYHAFSQVILHPWGCTGSSLHGLDGQLVRQFAADMQDRLNETGPRVYGLSRGTNPLRIGGEAGDWAYETYGTFCFTVELPPEPDSPFGFLLPAEEIGPVVDQAMPAAIHHLKELFALRRHDFAAVAE